MSRTIEKVAVIGSGVMGAGIVTIVRMLVARFFFLISYPKMRRIGVRWPGMPSK